MIDNRKLKSVILILFICVLQLTSACQPTPESEAIVNKERSLLDELVLEKADPNEKWEKTEDRIIWGETKSVNTEIGECNVTVSIDIETPVKPEQVPVYLIEPGGLSRDMIKTAVDFFLDGKLYDGDITKQDILGEKLDFEKEVSKHTILDKYRSDVEDYLDYYDEEYKKASSNNKEASLEFTEIENGYSQLCVKSYNDDNSIMRFSAYAYPDGRVDNCYLRVREFNKVFSYSNKLGDGTKQNASDIKFERAQTIVKNAISTLFEEEYAMVDKKTIDIKSSIEYLWNDRVETSLGQAYVFCYARKYGDYSSLYIDPTSTVGTEGEAYAKPYTREYIQFVADDKGIIYMNCVSFSEVIEELNDNVKLMRFDDVLEQFKKDVFYHFLWGRSAEITILRIEFGMVREPVKDNSDQYMMVPAWNFIGDVKIDWMQNQEKSILVLNAINGSIITDYESIADPK